MPNQFKRHSLIVGATLALTAGGVFAEQTIGVQPSVAPTTNAIATAHVNVRVTVPKIVILRVGAADGTTSDVNFTVGVGGTPAVTVGNNNQGYAAGAVPPTLTNTVATTNPTSATGQLTTALWTNVTGTKLTCTLGPLSGATAFAGTTAVAGVPNSTDVQVVGATIAHPGTTLKDCDGVTASATTFTPGTAYTGGTFTYSLASTFNSASSPVYAGVYGNVVTYAATTP